MCKSCDHHEKWGAQKGHEVYEGSFYCQVCEKETFAYSHEDEDFWGASLECSECHDYILYITPEKAIWKDETYVGDLCLIRNLEDNETSLIGANDRRITTVPGIMEINCYSDLKRRVKTLMVFS